MPPFGVDSMVPLSEIESILKTVNPRVASLEPRVQNEVVQLLKETLAVWVHSLTKHAETAESRQDVLKTALPAANGPNQNHIHAQILKRMNNTDCTPVAINHEMARMVAPSTAELWTFVTTEEVGRGMKYLLEEILELAANCALDNERNVLVPSDIRVAINNDPQFCQEGLNMSQVFWPPDMLVAKLEREE
jgi:histone H3/H4